MSEELENLIAQRFIQRRDVKAVQFNNGAWSPDYKLEHPGKHLPLGWERDHLSAHLAGNRTYGHYILDADDLCRVITFDIDLVDGIGTFCVNNVEDENDNAVNIVNPREVWQRRESLEARNWFKYQMKMLATRFCGAFIEMGLPTAAAYSGSKGVHVYGFVDPMKAQDAHEGALLALDMIDEFEPFKGKHMFIHRNPDPWQGYRNFTVEIYPKQESLQGKTLGNLLRLPLGRNLKSDDPTFFLDLTTPMAVFQPHENPETLLREGNPFS